MYYSFKENNVSTPPDSLNYYEWKNVQSIKYSCYWWCYGGTLAMDVPKGSGGDFQLLEDYFSGLKIAKYLTTGIQIASVI